MSLQVEQLEHNMAKLTIEVSAEELEGALQKAYQKQKSRINVPGFRKGKVPRQLIEKLLSAAVQAPNHHRVRPWRFIVLQGEARHKLGEVSDADVSRCESCDLLILDDLGTEMTTAFVQSALYQIVNGRMLSGRSTIISTNLAPEELGHRYGAPILSRIEGAYQILPFFGEDIRTKQ